eukprot:6061071-Pyramimonas_sp.AAC.1
MRRTRTGWMMLGARTVVVAVVVVIGAVAPRIGSYTVCIGSTRSYTVCIGSVEDPAQAVSD